MSSRLFAVFGIAVLCLIAPPAVASESFNEREAIIKDLGDNTFVITYWITTPQGYEVVTTVANEDAEGDQTIFRFTGVLLDGQSLTISKPVAIGERQPTIVVARVGNRIAVDSRTIDP
jgi:hypothetical protein